VKAVRALRVDSLMPATLKICNFFIVLFLNCFPSGSHLSAPLPPAIGGPYHDYSETVRLTDA
jgi:hypothetical protein